MIELMKDMSINPSINSEGAGLLLDMPLNAIQIPRWLNRYSTDFGYKPKNEYHVTIIGSDLANKIHDLNMTTEVKSLIKNYTWTIEIVDEYIELAKDDENGVHRQSIICFVEVPNLNQFYNALTNILGIDADIPPAHVTLYTKNYDRGIGLYSEKDLVRYKVRDLTATSLIR